MLRLRENLKLTTLRVNQCNARKTGHRNHYQVPAKTCRTPLPMPLSLRMSSAHSNLGASPDMGNRQLRSPTKLLLPTRRGGR